MRRWILLLLLITSCAGCFAQELSVAAASDLQFVMKDLSESFQRQTGIQVRATYGSSGNFAAQIQNGAPFDLFLSADIQYPEMLVRQGLADPVSLYGYAQGALVLWVPNGSPLDVTKGLDVLRDPRARKIAIANPKHAPYGRAAVEAIRASGMYEKISAKLVLGENISQTAQFVETGNADVGIIALSLAVAPGMRSSGRFEKIAPQLYAPIRQGAVVLSSSRHKEEAGKFMDFLKSKQAQMSLERAGFILPGPASATKP